MKTDKIYTADEVRRLLLKSVLKFAGFILLILGTLIMILLTNLK